MAPPTTPQPQTSPPSRATSHSDPPEVPDATVVLSAGGTRPQRARMAPTAAGHRDAHGAGDTASACRSTKTKGTAPITINDRQGWDAKRVHPHAPPLAHAEPDAVPTTADTTATETTRQRPLIFFDGNGERGQFDDLVELPWL